MVAIAYIYFLSLLNVAIRADLVARGRESDLGANISMVETIGKRDERQAIIMAKWLFGFDFRGAVVECSGADCEPVIEIRIIRESGESGGDRGPVNGKFFFFDFPTRIAIRVEGAFGVKGATSMASTPRSPPWWVERLAMGHESLMCPWRARRLRDLGR